MEKLHIDLRRCVGALSYIIYIYYILCVVSIGCGQSLTTYTTTTAMYRPHDCVDVDIAHNSSIYYLIETLYNSPLFAEYLHIYTYIIIQHMLYVPL